MLYISENQKKAPAILLYWISLFSCLSKSKLNRNGQYSVLLMVTVTSVPFSPHVRTYWSELQSSDDKPAKKKHPDTKEPIGTRTTVKSLIILSNFGAMWLDFTQHCWPCQPECYVTDHTGGDAPLCSFIKILCYIHRASYFLTNMQLPRQYSVFRALRAPERV